MSDHLSVSAPKTVKQRFGAQVGKFNNYYSDLSGGDRYTLTFDRTVENRINLHAGSPDEPAVASALFREEPADNASGVLASWATNDGQSHKTLHDAAEHMIQIRAQPRGEIVGGDATEVQGHPKFLTPTGRMSFSQPVMQELQTRVQADPRMDTETLRSADYSDFEQRILARMTPEQIEAFKAGEAVTVDLDGMTPGMNPCAEIITIGGGRADDFFGGGYRRSAEIDPIIIIEAKSPRRVGMLGHGAGLLAAAAAMSIGAGAGQLLPHHQTISRTLGKGKFKLRPKQRSSYSPCKASVTEQHKGSGDAKKAAQNVHKGKKAAKRAQRAKKLAKIAARVVE